MPWYWAINGATSVAASVLAVLISSTYGISAAWYAGQWSKATNTFGDEKVKPTTTSATLSGGQYTFPAHSLTILRLKSMS